LPQSSLLETRSGVPAWVDNKWFLSDDELKDDQDFLAFRGWIMRHGLSAYLGYALTHPWYMLSSLWQSPTKLRVPTGESDMSIADLFSVPHRGYLVAFTPYPAWLQSVLAAPFGWLVAFTYLGWTAATYVRCLLRGERAAVVDSLVLASFASIFISYHADAWGVWPHAVPSLVVIYVCIVTRSAPFLQRAGAWLIEPYKSRRPGDVSEADGAD
jgi:hypothetical protein